MPIWFYWAAASAVFAALTAIFAKLGLQGINSDFATFIRTIVIMVALVAFFVVHEKMATVKQFNGEKLAIFDFIGLGNRGIMGGVFQSLAIGQRFTSRTN